MPHVSNDLKLAVMLLYDFLLDKWNLFQDPNVVTHLVQFLSQSPTEAECAGNVLFRCCKVSYVCDVIT